MRMWTVVMNNANKNSFGNMQQIPIWMQTKLYEEVVTKLLNWRKIFIEVKNIYFDANWNLYYCISILRSPYRRFQTRRLTRSETISPEIERFSKKNYFSSIVDRSVRCPRVNVLKVLSSSLIVPETYLNYYLSNLSCFRSHGIIFLISEVRTKLSKPSSIIVLTHIFSMLSA